MRPSLAEFYFTFPKPYKVRSRSRVDVVNFVKWSIDWTLSAAVMAEPVYFTVH